MIHILELLVTTCSIASESFIFCILYIVMHISHSMFVLKNICFLACDSLKELLLLSFFFF